MTFGWVGKIESVGGIWSFPIASWFANGFSYDDVVSPWTCHGWIWSLLNGDWWLCRFSVCITVGGHLEFTKRPRCGMFKVVSDVSSNKVCGGFDFALLEGPLFYSWTQDSTEECTLNVKKRSAQFDECMHGCVAREMHAHRSCKRNRRTRTLWNSCFIRQMATIFITCTDHYVSPRSHSVQRLSKWSSYAHGRSWGSGL
jgi:hypothetical protein